MAGDFEGVWLESAAMPKTMTGGDDMANIQSLNDRQVEYFTESIPALGTRGTMDPAHLRAGDIVQALFNLGGNVVTYSFAAATTQYGIAHGLPYTPRGYLVIGTNAATSVYNGTSAWTSSDIFLESSAVAEVTLMIF
jgi:hypothetical protein